MSDLNICFCPYRAALASGGSSEAPLRGVFDTRCREGPLRGLFDAERRKEAKASKTVLRLAPYRVRKGLRGLKIEISKIYEKN